MKFAPNGGVMLEIRAPRCLKFVPDGGAIRTMGMSWNEHREKGEGENLVMEHHLRNDCKRVLQKR